MKKIILATILLLAITPNTNAQETGHISFSARLGTCIDMSTPGKTPFETHVTGLYNLSKRFSAGVGTGVSVYEKTLIPVYADIKYDLSKPHRFTPYLECGSGYSFATGRNANGGFYFNPSIGLQWAFTRRNKISFALGYEFQELERLKTYEDQYIETEFQEHLSHYSISLQIGYQF